MFHRLKDSSKKPSDEIPTSSTADIAFLLVVYFMLTVTFSATKGLDFSIEPDDKPVTVDPIESVLIEVRRSGELVVDHNNMTEPELLRYLDGKLKQNPSKPVILYPDLDAPYGSMIGVYDLLRRAKDILGLERDVQIALPSRRESAAFWS